MSIEDKYLQLKCLMNCSLIEGGNKQDSLIAELKKKFEEDKPKSSAPNPQY